MPPILRMSQIVKRFPGVVACDHVSLSVEGQTIHALVGENGAGKTTLMNVLYGLYRPDGGEIEIKGKRATLRSPSDAISLGLGMVHQHFMLVPVFTVAENVVLGHEPTRRGFMDKSSAEREVKELATGYGLRVDPAAKVADLPVGLQQRVEILKVLYRGADIIIMDEPTAVLTPQEVGELYQVMKGLKVGGKTVLFITHKLKEVMAISDNVTVMRRGRVVGTMPTRGTSVEELARLMIGREVEEAQKSPRRAKGVVLWVERLSALDDRGHQALRDLSLSVRGGEIVGVAGVEGNGQRELAEVLTGLRRATGGSFSLHEKEVTNQSPRQLRANGVGHIPEDRWKRGLILDFSVASNLILGDHYHPPYAGMINQNFGAINDHASALVSEYDIRPPMIDVAARTLSGGNQQKMILARELSADPDLLIADQPTRGLDIGATEFIHRQIITARGRDKAILYISADLDEILSISDRILVIYEGEIVGEFDPRKVTGAELGLYMTGAKKRGVGGRRGEGEGKEEKEGKKRGRGRKGEQRGHQRGGGDESQQEKERIGGGMRKNEAI